MSNSKTARIILTSRPAFLILTPCCLLLAIAYAVADHVAFSFLHLVLIIMGAVAAHASVNMFNEYGDFKTGLDFNTQRTPFSGGSGVLPSAPDLAESVNLAAIISCLVTLVIGCYFLWFWGWELLPVGLLGILLVYFYTHKITRNPWLCLIAPGLAFGPLMISGGYFALSGKYSLEVFSASMVVFFLVNNLLLLNQFPDMEPDRDAGRLHLPILIGRKKSAWVYVMFLVAACGMLLLNIVFGFLPILGLIGLLPIFLALPTAKRVVLYANDIEQLQPALALNVAISLSTPVLMAAGVILQALN